MTRLLFVHGAGGFTDDRPIADGLGDALGVPVDMPEFSGDDMSLQAWADPLRARLSAMAPDDLLVAHSFGASILLHVLAEAGYAGPKRAVLLAMPNWGGRTGGRSSSTTSPDHRHAVSRCRCTTASTTKRSRSDTWT